MITTLLGPIKKSKSESDQFMKMNRRRDQFGFSLTLTHTPCKLCAEFKSNLDLFLSMLTFQLNF